MQDVHPLFLVALVAVCGVLRQALPRTPRGWR